MRHVQWNHPVARKIGNWYNERRSVSPLGEPAETVVKPYDYAAPEEIEIITRRERVTSCHNGRLLNEITYGRIICLRRDTLEYLLGTT